MPIVSLDAPSSFASDKNLIWLWAGRNHLPEGGADAVLVFGAEVGVHGQAEDAARGGFRDGKAALGVAEILEGGLEMGGHGVMDGCGNSLLAERRGDAVAIVHFNGVLGVDAAVFRSDKRGLDEAAQMLVVASGNMGAKEQFPLENLKLGQQDSGLDSVEASVEAEADVAVAGGLAVVANFEHGGGECVVVCEAGPAVAISAKRLGGEKAGA